MIITYENRNLANESVDKQLRYMQILGVLDGGKEMTAKEIAVEMNKRGYIPTDERNFTSPRITELLYKGILDVAGKKKCQYTGKTVTIFKVR